MLTHLRQFAAFVLILMGLCSLSIMPIAAQDDGSAAYAEALRRIEWSRVSEGTISMSLDLKQVPITTLPSEIGQLSRLVWLYLSATRLTTLPPEIGQLDRLQDLELSATPFTTLPPEIGQLRNLIRLNLAGTQLTALPPEIGQLNNLKTLNLSFTPIQTLPSEIGQLTKLEMLDISNSQLATLPTEIGQLNNLKTLHLANTRLTLLPTEMGRLTNLERLVLPRSLAFPPFDIQAQGTQAILAYLRDYHAMLMRQTIAAVAAGIGGIALLIMAFRWRQRRFLSEKKKRA